MFLVRILERRSVLLNSVGAGFWVAGFFFAGGGIYPIAFVGVYLGPLLLLIGGVGWLRLYRREHGRLPDPIASFRRTLRKYKGILKLHLAMFDFMFSHLLAFWLVSVYFWVVLAFVGTAMMKGTDVYRVAVESVRSDTENVDGVGRVRYFGFLAGGTIRTEGISEISFTVIGENSTKQVEAKVETRLGRAQVVSVRYR